MLAPINAGLSHNYLLGSINLFFKTSDEPNVIFGITCAHNLIPHATSDYVNMRKKGNIESPIKGNIDKIYSFNTNRDLGVIAFKKTLMEQKYSLLHTQPICDIQDISFQSICFSNWPITLTKLKSKTSIQHNGKLLKNLHVFKKFGRRGDSGTSLLLKTKERISCLGHISLIKNEKTYVTDLQYNYQILRNDYQISNFYYLSNK